MGMIMEGFGLDPMYIKILGSSEPKLGLGVVWYGSVGSWSMFVSGQTLVCARK